MRKLIGATALMAAAALMGGVSTYHPQYHAGGKISTMFDLASIMHARKNNQRNKNQKRIKSRQ